MCKSETNYAIAADNVSKIYPLPSEKKELKAVNELSFRVPVSSCFWFSWSKWGRENYDDENALW